MKKSKLLLSTLLVGTIVVSGCSSKEEQKKEENTVKSTAQESKKENINTNTELTNEPFKSAEYNKIPVNVTNGLDITKTSAGMEFKVTAVGVYNLTVFDESKAYDDIELNKEYPIVQIKATVTNNSEETLGLMTLLSEINTDKGTYANRVYQKDEVYTAKDSRSVTLQFLLKDVQASDIKEFSLRIPSATKEGIHVGDPIKVVISL